MGGGRDWRDDVDRFDEPQPVRRRISAREEGYNERDDDDLYRSRRNPTRAAIPERAASRDAWESDRDRSAPPAANRYRAGSAPSDTSSREFGARRQAREETRRGSRPSSSSERMPRSSRSSGSADGSAGPSGRPAPGSAAAGIPEGTPYRRSGAATTQPASESGVSDAEFRPVPPSSRGNAGKTSTPAPRDNSSRFDD
jgi:hypothetical protein